ncbi:MAG: ParB/RepB/Spo0J family partition protein [Clostridia bacterium]|nr:ParB/RepB/Spo0J family partition protein [Clostridia bacterium]
MTSKTKGGLGRGIDAFFDTKSVSEGAEKDLVEITISRIEPNSTQPRKQFDEDQLKKLSDSIREHGIIQPIIVTPSQNGFYKIIAGERRWRAAKMCGLQTVPAIIKNYEDREAAEIALIENLQREDLNPIEEALGYKNLIEQYGLTQERVGELTGKSRSAIANSIRILSLPENIIKMVQDGLISEGHARTLLSVESDTKKQELAERIIKDQITVRELEKIAAAKEKPAAKKVLKLPEILDLEENLSQKLGSRVRIIAGKRKGKIEIEYYTNDDLERIISLFK